MDKANKRDFDSHYEYWDKVKSPQPECEHDKVVCINEEGNAGVFCLFCGEQLSNEC